jgi:hypothetical protein
VTARQIDQAASKLRDLKAQSLEDLTLAAFSLGPALVTDRLRPALAVPLVAGAATLVFLGLRALVRRSFLIEDLAVEPDAYEIAAVRSFGLRAASTRHRQTLAATIRAALAGSTGDVAARLDAARPELEELIADLEDERLCLEPAAAVVLERWLNDPESSFLDRSRPPEELCSRLRSILSAFEAAGGRP